MVLLTSEVATNAVLHAGGDFEVHVELLENEGIRVSVRDRSPHLPQRRVTTLDATTGRGLHLVDSLATAWGVDDHANGKVVWFEVRPVRLRAGSDLRGR